jgi:hypothetical protein
MSREGVEVKGRRLTGGRLDRLDLRTVLGMVVRGRAIRLDLEREQSRALRDPDGQIGLDVVRHLLGARACLVVAPAPFPLTEEAFQRVAGKLGHAVGIKRSRTIIRRLLATGVITTAGSYRQMYQNTDTRSGFRVTLFSLGAKIARRRSAPQQRAVGRRGRVKPFRWWKHGLFGTPDGRPPPGLSKRQRCRMRSADEREMEIIDLAVTRGRGERP